MPKRYSSGRPWIIGAALVALFLGALDALIMSAAMPTIISDLGGLDLYAWVYSAYFLARAVSLPVFGKLSDLYATKKLFLTAVILFISASALAGASPSMGVLILARVFQGLGAGGIFALVYVVLSDVSLPGQRAKTLSLASSVWGISSLIGPTLGGFIVTFFSWRWVFFINLPLGMFSLVGIALFFKEFRDKPKTVHLDWAGLTFMSGSILGLLILAMVGGRDLPWNSIQIIVLALVTILFGAGFYVAEKNAVDPILNLDFFKYPGFGLGNAIAFCASFSIFALFAYAPLFLQGALGRTPLEVGYAMLSLSLGWSFGSILMGRTIHRFGRKRATIAGILLLVAGCGLTLSFSRDTTLVHCFFVFLTAGFGMGFITLSTLLVVQDSLPAKHLGIATSLHQFSRTLGGAIGVGVCGAVVTTRLLNGLEAAAGKFPANLLPHIKESMENLFQVDFLALIPQASEILLKQAVANGVFAGFVVVFIASLVPLLLCFFLPGKSTDFS
ncbi:putative drug resistance permease (EmrB/QacA-family protein) [Desulforapulum autotrophicum HRM2]|uniref:Drug resistance permease (EmrB/QacA-family protein) n=1 Tax=Desulforapulum autotrophicum (strain ATCC 43914 / DSM 3382 / VKM B-1955 / HRM2) TaxID=177437 RepID=C0QFY4_DESAH|nr:DHA2 family efflux MFS transporter permease subunit [Desulforapulum autotrophicum]ACN15552.1 putative drug resistance permease (EmrB/QacA-family protein) [Desulforapulum autotrophicum HRM2]